MPPITIDDVRFFVIAFLLIGVIEAAWMAVKLLERCDRHLRAWRERALQNQEGRPQTADEREARREALGLSDGYPRVLRAAALRNLLTVVVVYGVARWWLA